MSSQTNTTIIICARDASETIVRAIQSVVSQADCPVLVVDDFSSDDTADRARSVGEDRVRIVRPDQKAGLGNARQKGIDSVDTSFAIWLDADDEFLPGRIDTFIDAFERGSTVVFDACELFDGISSKRIGTLDMPGFMRKPGAMVRTFERNYLPGPAWPGVCTEFAKKIGYDRGLPTGEDIDFNLRALAGGARFEILASIGYRQYHYPSSLSRNLKVQRAAVATALAKHDYQIAKGHYVSAGFSQRMASWALCSMALFRGEFDRALQYLDEACPITADPSEILDPDGPLPYTEGWKRAFYEGTIKLLSGGVGAEVPLMEAERLRPSAEGANNLGVALHRKGQEDESEVQFRMASARLPGYRDALLNQRSENKEKLITTHAMRSHASRNQY